MYSECGFLGFTQKQPGEGPPALPASLWNWARRHLTPSTGASCCPASHSPPSPPAHCSPDKARRGGKLCTPAGEGTPAAPPQQEHGCPTWYPHDSEATAIPLANPADTAVGLPSPGCYGQGAAPLELARSSGQGLSTSRAWAARALCAALHTEREGGWRRATTKALWAHGPPEVPRVIPPHQKGQRSL